MVELLLYLPLRRYLNGEKQILYARLMLYFFSVTGINNFH